MNRIDHGFVERVIWKNEKVKNQIAKLAELGKQRMRRILRQDIFAQKAIQEIHRVGN